MQKRDRGITLIALVITIIILLILAGISISTLGGENGLFARAKQAKEETQISNYKEQIELIKANLQIQNEDYKLPTIAQLKEEFDTKHKKWVSSTEIITDNGKEKLKLTTKEGYIFYITESTTEYKGKGKVVDTSALQRDDVIKLKKTQETEKGKLVQITDLSGQNYYKIKYQINSTEGEWQDIKSGNEVEVPYGGTIYAKLIYGSDSGIVHRLSVENSEPKVVAKEIDLSNLTRKTEISIADLFEITWGSDGTGTTEYTVTGNLNFNNTSFSSTKINNISNLELGTYTVTCKVISPTNKTVTATKDNVKVTTLASTTVQNTSNENVQAKAIYSEYDLAYFRDLVNGGQTSINGKMMNDIDLSKVCSKSVGSWTSIGNVTNAFKGIYDGAEKKLEGAYINTTSNNQGLFGYIENATIKNITLGTGTITGSYNVGGIVGYNNSGTISNCKNENTTITSTGYVLQTFRFHDVSDPYKHSNTGGIIGYNYNGNVNNCINNVTVIGNYIGIGGVIGTDNGTKERNITNCTNTANISNPGESGVLFGLAGIIGFSYNMASIKDCNNTGNISTNNFIDVAGITGCLTNATIENCQNTGNITGLANIGGICGEIEKIDTSSSTEKSNVLKSTNEGTITSTGYYSVSTFYENSSHNDSMSISGGIVGLSSSANIENCKNKGSVLATASSALEVGGVVGVGKENTTISKCSNLCNIEMGNGCDAIGGIAGYMNQSLVEESYNVGNITATSGGLGGIIGCIVGSTVENCYNIGNVVGNNYVGGIIGWSGVYKYSLGYEYLYNCYNIGETTGPSGTTDPFVGYANYMTWNYLYTINSVYKSDGKWINCSDGTFEALSGPGSVIRSTMLTNLLNGEGAGKWTRDTTGTINNGYPYLVNNIPE